MGNDFRERSRENWIASDGANPSIEQLTLGCQQRIADATEVMAKEYNRLIRERDNYKDWYQTRGREIDRLSRSNAALRGTITRMKKAAKA